MTQIQKDQFLALVYTVCEQEPTITREVIEAATEAVKSFADKQDDKVARLRAILAQLFDEYDFTNGTKYFTAAEILDHVAPAYTGTPWLAKMQQKYLKP
jgi:hypothetical protein